MSNAYSFGFCYLWSLALAIAQSKDHLPMCLLYIQQANPGRNSKYVIAYDTLCTNHAARYKHHLLCTQRIWRHKFGIWEPPPISEMGKDDTSYSVQTKTVKQ